MKHLHKLFNKMFMKKKKLKNVLDQKSWSAFKKETELKWKKQIVIPDNFIGFMINQNTKWLDGFLNKEIDDFEVLINKKLPYEVKKLLTFTRGLDKPSIAKGYVEKSNTIEVYETENRWRFKIEEFHKPDKNINKQTWNILKKEFGIDNKDKKYYLLPIYGHRYVLCNQKNLDTCKVFSIYDDDIVLYSENIKSYLYSEFLV